MTRRRRAVWHQLPLQLQAPREGAERRGRLRIEFEDVRDARDRWVALVRHDPWFSHLNEGRVCASYERKLRDLAGQIIAQGVA